MFSILEKKSNEYFKSIKELEKINSDIKSDNKKIYTFEMLTFLIVYLLLIFIPFGSLLIKNIVIIMIFSLILYFFHSRITNYYKKMICSVKLEKKKKVLKRIYTKEREIIEYQNKIQNML